MNLNNKGHPVFLDLLWLGHAPRSPSCFGELDSSVGYGSGSLESDLQVGKTQILAMLPDPTHSPPPERCTCYHWRARMHSPGPQSPPLTLGLTFGAAHSGFGQIDHDSRAPVQITQSSLAALKHHLCSACPQPPPIHLPVPEAPGGFSLTLTLETLPLRQPLSNWVLYPLGASSDWFIRDLPCCPERFPLPSLCSSELWPLLTQAQREPAGTTGQAAEVSIWSLLTPWVKLDTGDILTILSVQHPTQILSAYLGLRFLSPVFYFFTCKYCTYVVRFILNMSLLVLLKRTLLFESPVLRVPRGWHHPAFQTLVMGVPSLGLAVPPHGSCGSLGVAKLMPLRKNCTLFSLIFCILVLFSMSSISSLMFFLLEA